MELLLVGITLIWVLLFIVVLKNTTSIMKRINLMMKKINGSEFTHQQKAKLQSAVGSPTRYEKLRRFYKALNASSRYGRVLDLKGNVVHPGFEVITGGKDVK